MPNQINTSIVRELSGAFGAEGMVFVSLSGLSVKETETLRCSLAEQGVQLRVVKNRLATIALKENGHEAPKGFFAGSIGACWGSIEETIGAAKVVHTSDPHKAGKVAIKGAVLEGRLLGAAQAIELASLPGRNELRAKLLGTIAAPMQQLVSLLAAPQRAVARVLQARVDAAGTEGDA